MLSQVKCSCSVAVLKLSEIFLILFKDHLSGEMKMGWRNKPDKMWKRKDGMKDEEK